MKNLYYFMAMAKFLNELHDLWLAKNFKQENKNNDFYQEQVDLFAKIYIFFNF